MTTKEKIDSQLAAIGLMLDLAAKQGNWQRGAWLRAVRIGLHRIERETAGKQTTGLRIAWEILREIDGQPAPLGVA